MTLDDILRVAATILASIGGAGVIVLSFSSWLGKVWANRIMATETATHSRELERLRADLTHRTEIALEAERAKYSREIEELRAQLIRSNEESLSRLKSDLEIQRHAQIQEYQDKLAIYRLVSDIVGDILADLDRLDLTQPLPPEIDDRFNRGRLKASGYLAVLAPQEVWDAFNELMDYLLAVTNGEESYDWEKVRTLSTNGINQMRADVGINKTPIEYRGNR